MAGIIERANDGSRLNAKGRQNVNGDDRLVISMCREAAVWDIRMNAIRQRLRVTSCSALFHPRPQRQYIVSSLMKTA